MPPKTTKNPKEAVKYLKKEPRFYKDWWEIKLQKKIWIWWSKFSTKGQSKERKSKIVAIRTVKK